MKKIYKFLLKKLVCNKVRNIYIKINSKSKKQYLKYKDKMINIRKYKKIKSKKKTRDLKNKNNKIYRKKKGGYNIEEEQDKLKRFIDTIKFLDIENIVEIQDAFFSIYTKIANRNLDEEASQASQNEHLNFLIALLIYFEYNFLNLENIEYKKILDKISQLLQTIEESAITGIYSYNSVPSRNPYVINNPINFKTIIDVINKFSYKHKSISWTPFLQKGKKLTKENITISNTQVITLIKYMKSDRGLNKFDSKYKPTKYGRYTPY